MDGDENFSISEYYKDVKGFRRSAFRVLFDPEVDPKGVIGPHVVCVEIDFLGVGHGALSLLVIDQQEGEVARVLERGKAADEFFCFLEQYDEKDVLKLRRRLKIDGFEKHSLALYQGVGREAEHSIVFWFDDVAFETVD